MTNTQALAESLAKALKDDGIRATVEVATDKYAMVSTLLGDLRISVTPSTTRVDATLSGTDLSGIALIATNADLWLTKLRREG